MDLLALRRCLWLLSAAFPLAAQAPSLRLSHLYGDHMVLPSDAAVPLRGFGAPGGKIAVQTSWGAAAEGAIGSDGRFAVELRTPAPGGPHQLVVQSGDERLELRDLRAGIVLLAAGQSNMEMPLGDHGGWRGGTRDWQREVAAANDNDLRFLTVAQAVGAAPAADCDGAWQVCSPATAAGFSAVAYYCAKALRAARGVPVGVVVAAWGGTVAEAWTSPAGLAGFPEFAADLRAAMAPPTADPALARERFWRAVPNSPPAGGGEPATLPERWSSGPLAAFDGVAFYARSVPLPAGWAGRELQLELGAIDDCDTVFVGGERLDGMEVHGAWNTPRRYTVPAARTAGATALRLLVRVVDTGGEGGFAGPAEALCLRGPDGSVPLSGAWARWRGPALDELPPWPRDPSGEPNRPAVLWHGMVAPLLPFPFTAALWYQGESNVGRPEQYARLFPALVVDWRAHNGGALPFFAVQIAPHAYRRKDDAVARLRLAQEALLALPETGLVATLDCGDARDIHPIDKAPVGARLAAQVQAVVFGAPVVASGPVPRGCVREGEAVRIEFDSAAGGLLLTEPTGFELAGADGVFHAAAASVVGEALRAVAAAVPAPRQVRYAHAEVPTPALRNGAGWPARPFCREVAGR